MTGALIVVLILIAVGALVVFVAQTAQGNDHRKLNRRDGVLVDFEGLRLTRTHLIDGYAPDAKRIPLLGALAQVTQSGELSSRLTVTRLAAFGIVGLALPKTTDTRQLVLLVAGMTENGEGWHAWRTVKSRRSDPAALPLAHTFANAVTSSATLAAATSELQAARAADPVGRPSRTLGLRKPAAQ